MLTTNTDRLQNLSMTNISANSFNSDHHVIQFNLFSKNGLRHVSATGSVYNYIDYSGMDYYLMKRYFNNISPNPEDLGMSLKSAMLEACKLFVPKAKHSLYQYPKWFSPEIKHLLNCVRSLRHSIEKSYTVTKANKLTYLEFKLQALMTTAKEIYRTKLTAAFSH